MFYVLLAVSVCILVFLMGAGYVRTLREGPHEKAPELPRDLPHLADAAQSLPEDTTNAITRLGPGEPTPVQGERGVTITSPAYGEPEESKADAARRRQSFSANVLHRDLRWLQLLSSLLLLVCGAASCVGLVALFSYLHQLRLDGLPSSVAMVAPLTLLGSLLPGFLLCFPAAPLPTIAFVRLVLGRNRYEAFFDYDYGRTGVRNPGVLKRVVLAVFAVLCLVSAGSLLMTMNWYTRFEQGQVVVKPAWSLGERAYPYERVRAVRLTDTQKHFGKESLQHTKFEVEFDDGYVWHCDDYDSFWMDRPVNADERERLLRCLEEQTGRPLVHTGEDLPVKGR